MNVLRSVGLVVGGALLFAGLLYVARYYGGAIPIPFAGMLLAVLAVAGPSVGISLLASRWGLWQPRILAVIAYCLGSGIATAALMGTAEPASRYVIVALQHAVSLTVLMPAEGGGLLQFWSNLLWVAVAYLVSQEGVSLARKRSAAPEPSTQEPG